MAYRKFRRTSFRRRGRRSFKRNFRRRVRRIAYSIAEKKYYEYTLSGSDSPVVVGHGAAWTAPLKTDALNAVGNGITPRSLINTLPIGTTFNTRIGNKIFVEYVQLSMFVQFDSVEAGAQALNMGVNGCVMRYGVYYDRQHGSNPAVLNSLYSAQTITPGYQFGAMRNVSTLGKYKTLRDKQIRVAYANTDFGSGVPAVQEYIPIKREFTFSGSNSDLTDGSNLPRNDLGFVLCCNHLTSCYAKIVVRVCFRDA